MFSFIYVFFSLGLFLCYRVLLSGGDQRFDKVKTKPTTFFIYWMIQGESTVMLKYQ